MISLQPIPYSEYMKTQWRLPLISGSAFAILEEPYYAKVCVTSPLSHFVRNLLTWHKYCVRRHEQINCRIDWNCLICSFFLLFSLFYRKHNHNGTGQDNSSLALPYRAHRLHTNGTIDHSKDTSTKVYQSKYHAAPKSLQPNANGNGNIHSDLNGDHGTNDEQNGIIANATLKSKDTSDGNETDGCDRDYNHTQPKPFTR